MIFNETFNDGICVAAEIIDLESGTVTYKELDEIVEVRDLTEEEIIKYTPAIDPKQELLDRVNQASSIEDIKTALADVLAIIG